MLDFSSEICQDVLMPLLVGGLGIGLLLDQLHPRESSVPVDESNPISVTFSSGGSDGPANVRLDDFQWMGTHVGVLRFEGQLSHLAHGAWLAELGLARVGFNVLQLSFGNQLLDLFVSNVTHVTMHDVDVDC